MSNAQKYSPPFTGDLLHPYFKDRSRLLTVADVAARLGACAATVYKLCATGVLAHVRILNSIRFTQESVETYIASKRRYAARRQEPK